VNNRGGEGKVVLCTEMERHEGKERERGGRREEVLIQGF